MLYTSYGTPISYETAATRYEIGVSAAQYSSFPASRTRVEDHAAWRPEMGVEFITPFDPQKEALGQGKQQKPKVSPKRKQSLRRLLKKAIKQSFKEIVGELKGKHRGSQKS
ncbi:hypothetical protein EYR38_000996 [Pleurotus pulmonarius]|nr:hypothetical protein EYR38_000996 [Pleurotus pulmonarius]